MKYHLFKRYFISTSFECYNNNLTYIQNIESRHVKIKNGIVTFYSNHFIDIEGFKCEKQFKLFIKNKMEYYLIFIVLIISILLIMFVSPYYIKEVEYQNGSIEDEIIFNETSDLVKKQKQVDLNGLSKQFMLKYPHYSWISLKKKGNIVLLNIELNELSSLNYLTNNIQGDFISGYDAYIKHIIVTQGKVNVDINQTVKKGDLLILGNLPKQKISPCGIIIGEIVYSKEITIYKNNMIKSYTGNLINYQYVKLKDKQFHKNNNTYLVYKTRTNNIFSLFNFISYVDETIYEIGDFLVQYGKEDAIIYGKSIIYYELEKQRTSNKESILSIDVLSITEKEDRYVIKFLVKADKNIVLLKQ